MQLSIASAYEKYFKELQLATNRNTQAILKAYQVNDANVKTMQGLIEMANMTNYKLTQSSETLPTFLHIVSIVQIGIQRYADLLDHVRESLKKGHLDMAAAQILDWINEDEFYQSTEDTKVVSVYVKNDQEIIISLILSVRDPNVVIYKVVPFKQWIDRFTYMHYTGPEYIMYNSTSNCTTFIPKPNNLLVREYCLSVNESISLEDGASWEKVYIGKKDNTERMVDMTPEIFDVEDKHYVNCYFDDKIYYYNNTITPTEDDRGILSCQNGPHIIDSHSNYSIVRGKGKDEVLIHNYEYTVSLGINKQDLTPLELKKEDSGSPDPFKQIMQNTINTLNAAHVKNEEIAQEFWSHSLTDKIKGNVITTGLSTSTIIIIVIGMFIYWKCRKSELVQLMESSMKQQIVNNLPGNSERRTSRPPFPTPSMITNITLNATIPPVSTSNQRTVNFAEIYPHLPRQSIAEQQRYPEYIPMITRNPTPYHSRSRADITEVIDNGESEGLLDNSNPTAPLPSSSTVNGSAGSMLKNMIPDFSRFKKKEISSSTLSMPESVERTMVIKSNRTSIRKDK